MIRHRRLRAVWLGAALGSALAAGACSALLPKPAPASTFYAVDGAPTRGGEPPVPARISPATGLTLIVNPPQAFAGFDSPHIVYLRQAHKPERFAHSLWVDTPARMLTPLIANAVLDGGLIRAAVPPSAAAAGELRLDTEIVRPQQEFWGRPSRVRFTLRATLLDEATRRVLATREFDESVAAPSDDPYGGVIAANRAVGDALQALAEFCDQAAAQWQAMQDKTGGREAGSRPPD